MKAVQAVFTIVAKNYIPLANILGDSLKKIHPDLNFFIIVADREDGLIQFNQQRYPIISAEDLGIISLKQMAFKYNVTEFCTFLKPFSFRYLFEKGFERVIYFDPDIYVFNPLDKLFNDLEDCSMILTPHYSTVQDTYTGLFNEGNILFAGIFNLGFCALKQSTNGQGIISWWSSRLLDQCYADRTDGLHVDQKWTDFLPILFDDIKIEKGLGYNMAVWNWHERQIISKNGHFFVTNRVHGGDAQLLVFYHFSNYKFKDAADIKRYVPVNVTTMPDVMDVSKFYADLLVQENIAIQLTKLSYSYSAFDNGKSITHFHRRFYRRLLDINKGDSDPFNTSRVYYQLLSKNKLISNDRNIDKLNESNFEGFDRKLLILNKLSMLLKLLIGFDRYALLCKFMYRYVRAENQVFLIKEYSSLLSFINENKYINSK
ncbi:hypothetical protein [Fibrella arboris]|uniref:hypothetical protein n=1 Tax=Fibrella arboris TaxID=3242486 RepID=UPI0035212F17